MRRPCLCVWAAAAAFVATASPLASAFTSSGFSASSHHHHTARTAGVRSSPLVRRRAEPIPIGTIDGSGGAAASRAVQATKNVDRTARFFPGDLDADVDGPPVDRIRDVAEIKARVASQAAEAASTGALLSFGGFDAAAAVLWSVVLWYGVLNDVFFARAERPSDLVLPAIGRLLGFRADKDKWLADFENGSRGRFPLVVRAVAVPFFLFGGVVVEQGLKLLYAGGGGGMGDESSVFSLQLGVIGCIWAGVYEIGRIETGDALNSRDEDDERARVWGEMSAFADKTLERVPEYQGSVNAIEIVRAFRRAHTRHRRPPDSQPGSASDALLVEMFRTWHQRGYATFNDGYDSFGVQRSGSYAPKPTSAGFYKGLRFRSATNSGGGGGSGGGSGTSVTAAAAAAATTAATTTSTTTTTTTTSTTAATADPPPADEGTDDGW